MRRSLCIKRAERAEEDAIAEADILRSIISKLTREVKAKEGQLEKTGRDMAATVKTYMERTERADASKENATAVAIMLQATIDELTEQYKVKERRYKQQLTN